MKTCCLFKVAYLDPNETQFDVQLTACNTALVSCSFWVQESGSQFASLQPYKKGSMFIYSPSTTFPLCLYYS